MTNFLLEMDLYTTEIAYYTRKTIQLQKKFNLRRQLFIILKRTVNLRLRK